MTNLLVTDVLVIGEGAAGQIPALARLKNKVAIISGVVRGSESGASRAPDCANAKC